MTLVRICDYFVKSRLSYGLCCFLDCPSSVKLVENSLAKDMKGILGLPTNTSHRRLYVLLGEPDLEIRLAIRLLKNWHVYKRQFEDYPKMYEKTLLKYFSNDNLYKEDEFKSEDIKKALFKENIKAKAIGFMNVEIRANHDSWIKTKLFTYSDKRNFHLIRYLSHTTRATNLLLFPHCECGITGDRTIQHTVNNCKLTLIDREKTLLELNTIYERNKLNKKKKL